MRISNRLVKRSKVFFLILFGFGSSSAFSQFELSVHEQLIENPRLFPDQEERSNRSDLLSRVTARINVAQSTQRFSTSIDYLGSFDDYKKDFLRDRRTVTGRSVFTWIAKPDNIYWTLSNNRNDTLSTLSGPDTVNNRDIISVTSTGPQVNFALGVRNQVNLGLNYAVTGYNRNPANNQTRKSANFSFDRALSSRLRFSLSSSYSESGFNSTPLFDYELSSYSATLDFSAVTYGVTLQGGEYNSKRALAADSTSPLLTVSGFYQPNTSSRFDFNYSETAQDNTSSILENFDVGSNLNLNLDVGVDNSGNSVNSGLYELESQSFLYTFTSDRIVVSARYSNSDRKYVARSEVESVERASLRLTFPISDSLGVVAYGTTSESDFILFSRSQSRNVFGLNVSYQMNTRFSLKAGVNHTAQTGNLTEDNYAGANIFLTLTYKR